jgi:hypothetical protein
VYIGTVLILIVHNLYFRHREKQWFYSRFPDLFLTFKNIKQAVKQCLDHFLDGQLSGIAQLSLTAVFWESRAPVETQKEISVFYSIIAHNYRYYIPLKKHCEGSNIVPIYAFEILLFFLRVSQSGFGQDYDIGKFCLKPTLCNYVQHLLLACSLIFVNRLDGILIL